ncbi:MAG: ureidoglycolate lyase [Ignavibacteriaceae bacterium]
MNIRAKKISQKNFIRFGNVVITPDSAPTSKAADYKFWSDIAHFNTYGYTEIGICTVYKQPEYLISAVERHMLTPEILIPIDAPFVLPVLIEGQPDSNAEAFLVNIGQAIILNRAVWHGACLPVGKNESSYFVLFKRNTPLEDVEKKNIQELKIEF